MNKLAILKMSKKKIIGAVCVIAAFAGGAVVGAQINANAENNAIAVLPVAKGGTGQNNLAAVLGVGSANKLSTARTFALTGLLSGSVSSDLSGNVTIAGTNNFVRTGSVSVPAIGAGAYASAASLTFSSAFPTACDAIDFQPVGSTTVSYRGYEHPEITARSKTGANYIFANFASYTVPANTWTYIAIGH
jgi:hypothetical protein